MPAKKNARDQPCDCQDDGKSIVQGLIQIPGNAECQDHTAQRQAIGKDCSAE